MTRIGILASGTGSNALNINNYFLDHPDIEIAGVYCNKKDAGIVKSAPENNMQIHVFSREEFKDGSFLDKLKKDEVDYIVLAGFLWLIPENIIEYYEGKIVNIHPALLPAYGGKGMYGSKVHEAVVNANERESGITIHKVNAEYDKGSILFQAKVDLETDETSDSLAAKIHQLEYTHFPRVIEEWILSNNA